MFRARKARRCISWVNQKEKRHIGVVVDDMAVKSGIITPERKIVGDQRPRWPRQPGYQAQKGSSIDDTRQPRAETVAWLL